MRLDQLMRFSECKDTDEELLYSTEDEMEKLTWKAHLKLIDSLEGRKHLKDDHDIDEVYHEVVIQSFWKAYNEREEKAKTVTRALNVGKFN